MLFSSWGVGTVPVPCVLIPTLTSTGKGARGGEQWKAVTLWLHSLPWNPSLSNLQNSSYTYCSAKGIQHTEETKQIRMLEVLFLTLTHPPPSGMWGISPWVHPIFCLHYADPSISKHCTEMNSQKELIYIIPTYRYPLVSSSATWDADIVPEQSSEAIALCSFKFLPSVASARPFTSLKQRWPRWTFMSV